MRLKNALKNSVFGTLSQVILIIVGIILQRVLVYALTDEMIGLNAVFANIISLLSLSEMGVASAIVYNLYEPLATGNEEMIRKLMLLFKKAYRYIAITVTILGFVITPFVRLLLDEKYTESGNFNISFVRAVFLLLVAKTAASYLFSYKRSLLNADQKSYISVGIDLLFRTLSAIASFLFLYLASCGKEAMMLVYLGINALLVVAENIFVSFYVDRLYPFIKQKSNPLSKTESKKIFADVKNIFVGKLSGAVLNSTDNIIISKFVGLTYAGFYSNYNLIIASIQNIITRIISGLQSSIGNLFVEKNMKKNHDILRQLSFLFYWLGSLCSVCLFCLIGAFVKDIWLDDTKALPLYIVGICVTVFFLICVRGPLWSMVGVSGLFAKDKYISITGTVTNLVVSIVLVIVLGKISPYAGMLGVFIGTLVSQLTQLILKTKLFFGSYLKMNPMRYIVDMTEYFALTALIVAITYSVCTFLPLGKSIFAFAVKAVICALLPNILNLLVFLRDERFKSMTKLLKHYLRGGKKKIATESK